MNVAQMLMQTVTPLAERDPDPNRKIKRPHRHSTNPTAANNARRTKAEARYKAAIGTDWVHKTVIEDRLGISRTASNDALASYLSRGLVERRPIGGVFVQTRGYEWRWIAK